MSLQKIIEGTEVEIKTLNINIELLQERINMYDKIIEDLTYNIINVIKVR